MLKSNRLPREAPVAHFYLAREADLKAGKPETEDGGWFKRFGKRE